MFSKLSSTSFFIVVVVEVFSHDTKQRDPKGEAPLILDFGTY